MAVEHLVDVVAEVFGETGDVAAALTGTEMGQRSVGVLE